MRIDGRGIAVGLGVAIVTLILVGAASHHLHNGFDGDADVGETVSATGGATGDTGGSPGEAVVISELMSNGDLDNGDGGGPQADPQEHYQSDHHGQQHLQVDDFAGKAKQVVNRIVEIVGDNLARVERAIENDDVVCDSTTGATTTASTTSIPEKGGPRMQDIPFVTIPINPITPKQRHKHRKQQKQQKQQRKQKQQQTSEDATDDEVVKLPQYKESFLDSILRFFSGPSGGVPRSRRAVHAPAAMVRARDTRGTKHARPDSNSFSAFKRAHQS